RKLSVWNSRKIRSKLQLQVRAAPILHLGRSRVGSFEALKTGSHSRSRSLARKLQVPSPLRVCGRKPARLPCFQITCHWLAGALSKSVLTRSSRRMVRSSITARKNFRINSKHLAKHELPRQKPAPNSSQHPTRGRRWPAASAAPTARRGASRRRSGQAARG